MADYGERTIGLESGNPHYQGQSIWDLMRPNPQGEEEIQQNLYGAGAIGQDMPTSVTEGRSPLGNLLQGIGILGQPSPRALTPFEQFMYQQGQHFRGEQSDQTQKQQLQNLAGKFGLAGQVMKATGGSNLPPDIANLFPPEDQQLLNIGAQHFSQVQDLSDQIKRATLANIQAETEDRLKRATADNDLRNEYRQNQIYNQMYKHPTIEALQGEYGLYTKALAQELQSPMPDTNKISNLQNAMNQTKVKITKGLTHLGMPPNIANAGFEEQDQLGTIAGPKVGPNQGNMINSPQGVGQLLQQQNYPGAPVTTNTGF